MHQNIPAISVIIPMYNAEKFIGACLESLFAQTFKDFEIIVVDNCSTDNSCAVVENYLKRGGQLKLFRSNKNSGTPSRPRNRGLNFSHGKYIYFMDADDLLTRNTLESLYNYAEEYQVDVISMNTYFYFYVDVYEPFPKILSRQLGYSFKTPMPILNPEIESDDPVTRIENLFKGKFWVPPWTKFSRRDLLIEKEILFLDIRHGEDEFWTVHLVSEAKKILCIPETFYIYRILPKSHSHVEHDANFWITAFVGAAQAFCILRDKNKFLSDNPKICYEVSKNLFIERYLEPLCQKCFINLEPHEVFQTALKEFSNKLDKSSDNIAEICADLCAMLDSKQKQLYLATQRIAELEKSLSKN